MIDYHTQVVHIPGQGSGQIVRAELQEGIWITLAVFPAWLNANRLVTDSEIEALLATQLIAKPEPGQVTLTIIRANGSTWKCAYPGNQLRSRLADASLVLLEGEILTWERG